MDESKIPKKIRLAMEITDLLKKCETTAESLTVLSNVTFNIFLVATKPGRTLIAFRSYCDSLRDKLIAAEEAGIKSVVDNLQEITEEQITGMLDDLKKTVESMFKKEDFDFKKDDFDFRSN